MSLSPPGEAPGPKISVCPRCGTELPMEGRFCGQCGHVLGADATIVDVPAPAAAAPPPALAVPAMPATPPAAEPPSRAPMRTMMGVAPGLAPPVAAPPAPALPAAPVQVGTAHKTMVGMVAAPLVAPAAVANAPASAAAPGGPAPVANAHKTMMGVAPVGAPSAVGAPSVQPAPVGPAVSPRGPLAVANAQATMMGVENPVRGRSERPPMMGGVAPGVPPDTLPPGGGRPALRPVNPSHDSSSTDDALAAVLPGRRSRTGLWVFLAVAILGGGGTIAYLARGRSTHTPSPIQAELITAEGGGLAMAVVVPDAPSGTLVRYGSQTIALDAQHRARFTLNDLGERVGAVDLPLDIESNGTHEQRTARIVLGYRVQPDLAGLASDPPTLRLLFRVVPGSRLTIEGQNVATDQRGAAVATMDNFAPMPIDGPATREQPLHVQVTAPDGTVTSGTYLLRVPRTALVVDRPASAMVTASAQIVVRGRAPGAQRVTVNGRPVTPRGDVFEAAVPLQPGHQLVEVRAFAPTAAPALARVDVERANPNDRQAATRFLGNGAAGIADLAGGATQPGRRVRIQGRVLSPPRDYEGGLTFQLVVNDRACGPSPCVVWVDTEPGAAPAVNDNVEVDGTVAGRRQWVTTTNERRTDPVVTASFIF